MLSFLFKKCSLGNDLLLVIFLIITALIVRYSAFSFLHSPYEPYTDYKLYSDDANYMAMARGLIEGKFSIILHPIWPPLYPIASSFFYLLINNILVKDWAIVGRLTSIFFGALLIIPVYFFVKTYVNSLSAIFACIFVIFFNPLVYFSIRPLSEPLYLFCFWMGLFFIFKSIKSKRSLLAFFSGISFALATLTEVKVFLLLQ